MKKWLFIVLIVSSLSACINNKEKKTVLVYINSGAIQCQTEGKKGLQTERLLTEKNVAVSKTQCGHLSNLFVTAMCGALATNINVHEIKRSDFKKAQALGFEDVFTLMQENNAGYTVNECQ